MKIAYMGTADFAVPALEKLIDSQHEVVCAVSQPDSNKDRGKKLKATPVKEVATRHDIPVLQPDKIKNNEEFLRELSSFSPDLIVVAAYGKILPKEVLEMAPMGCVNIHGSILPRWRGAAPVQRSVMAGDEISGVTLMYMEEGLDTGDMIAKSYTSVDRKNCSELFMEIAHMGAELLIENLEDILSGKSERVKQNDDEATYAHMLSKQEGLLDFSKSAEELDNEIRGLFMWPGAYTYKDGELFKIWEAEVGDESVNKERPGTIVSFDNNGIEVATGKGILVLKTIQVPNKRRMSVADFIKGNKLEKGTVLG